MPAAFCGLLAVCEVEELVLVDLLGLLGADHTDLIIAATETSAGVDHRVDVQFRCLWLTRELA